MKPEITKYCNRLKNSLSQNLILKLLGEDSAELNDFMEFTGMFDPVPLNLPAYPFRIKQENNGTFIFDEIRKRFLVLTPEEWVRQHLVQFLIRDKKYPKSLIKLEGGLKLNSLQKRSDILLFNNSGKKILLVECKAPTVKITQETFDQIARYNFIHRVQWLLVSNGLQHFCCEIDFEKKSYRFVEELPEYLA